MEFLVKRESHYDDLGNQLWTVYTRIAVEDDVVCWAHSAEHAELICFLLNKEYEN